MGGAARHVLDARGRGLDGRPGSQHLGLARTLQEVPHARAAFRSGRISEWRAQVLMRETACPSREDRAGVDAAVAADPDRLAAMNEGEVVGKLRDEAYRRDPLAPPVTDVPEARSWPTSGWTGSPAGVGRHVQRWR